MPIRIKLKDQDQPIMIRVDADEWAKAYERARSTNGMIQVHEDGRTLAINAGQIVLWESISDPDLDRKQDSEPDPEPTAEPAEQVA
jgi:hypothetical protein